MKLNERQIAVRRRFRELVIEYFWHPKFIMMFNVTHQLAKEFDVAEYEILTELAQIPSIGYVSTGTPIQAWLAQRYQPVSNALYNKASHEVALSIWSKTKLSFVGKRPKEDKKLSGEISRHKRKIRAIAELHKNKLDRWAASDWNKVK